MSKLFIDSKAIEFIKNALEKENVPAMRLFISGGGCCKQFELTPVKQALAGDVTFKQSGIAVYVEKELVDNTKTIEIGFDDRKGLIINFDKN